MPRGFTIQIMHSITQAESPFMDVLSNHTCTGIINDKTMPHFIHIKYKIRIQCIEARAYTNKEAFDKKKCDSNDVTCLMLATMSPELQK